MSYFFPQQIGGRLKKARETLGLSTLEASKIIGVEKNSYYKYEDGSRFPRLPILASIMYNLNLNLNYLLTGEGSMFLTPRLPGESTYWGIGLTDIFPGLSKEVFPLVESLQVPVMKHALMMEYLIYKEKYREFIEEHFKEKEGSQSTADQLPQEEDPGQQHLKAVGS